MDTPARVFTPGAGALPPALAGRRREESVFLSCLADLARGHAPPHDVVLTGPRGNGKTALLNWFEGECRAKGGVDVVRLTPSRARTGEEIVEALLPATGLRKLLPAKWSVAWIARGERSPAAPAARLLTERLIARCRARALAVLAALERIGFVWRPPGQPPPPRYEPGIPSLMGYVLEHHARPPAGGRADGGPPGSGRDRGA